MEHTFKVGDRVQFKSWEEMEKEFGLDYGAVRTTPSFTIKMRHLCETYATIENIYKNGDVELIDFSISKEKRNAAIDWFYSLDMLKPVKEEKKYISDLPLDERIKCYEEKLAKLKAQKEKEKWVFTEDEKVILRNLPEDYKYIVRESKEGGEDLTLFSEKPTKGYYNWEGKNWHCIREFSHLFQCIQFTDTEPCEFRKYI